MAELQVDVAVVHRAAQVHSWSRERVEDLLGQGMAVRHRARAEQVRAPLAVVYDAFETCSQVRSTVSDL